MASNLIPVSGNTYPVKDQLKALGGRWNADRKCWMIPEENANKAFALVQSAPRKLTPSNGSYRRYSAGRWNGCSMGCRKGAPNPRCRTCMFDEFDN